MKVKDLIKFLEEDGWEWDRQESSHRVFKKEGMTDNIAVNGKPSDDVGKGLLGQVKRKAGWK